MRQSLDPKVDVIFKMLFADTRNRDVLIRFLTAVLRPSSPIVEVEVINPKIWSEDDAKKGIELDLRCHLLDGRYVNVEMQMEKLIASLERWLYYWAGGYSEQLKPGDGYHQLKPNVCIVIQNYVQFDTPRFHNVFRVLEVHDQTEFSPHLELHTLELPKLKAAPAATDDQAVLDWGAFFAAETDQQLEQLAMNNPDIARAKEALDQLSQNPEARRLAEARQRALLDEQERMRAARTEGKAEGLRVAVQSLCEVLGIELSPPRRARLDQAAIEDLQDLHAHIVQNRSWPDPS